MNKYLGILAFAMTLLLTAGTCTMADVDFKLGYDYYGYHDYQHIISTAKSSESFDFELTNPEKDNHLQWGAGVEVEMMRKIKDTEQCFQFIPVYALLNYYATEYNKGFYFTGRLGWDIFVANSIYKGNGNVEGNCYYAAGGGYNISRQTKIELLYSDCRGSHSSSSVNYSRTSLMIGFNFK